MKNAVVIGTPISHSKSPLIHQYWLKKYQIEGSYKALELLPADLNRFIENMRSGTYVGANVTLPHKVSIHSHCDQLSPSAQQLGALNTLYMRGNILVGDNTDAYGFLANLDQVNKGWDTGLARVVVLGAGGAARAVISALLSRNVGQIVILNRTLKKAQDNKNRFAKLFPQTNIRADNLFSFNDYASKTDMLINTSSIGLNNTRFENIDMDLLPKHASVHDIVYSPLLTPLLMDAKSAGLTTIDGLGMLLHQAAPGFKKWFGIFPEVTRDLRDKIVQTL